MKKPVTLGALVESPLVEDLSSVRTVHAFWFTRTSNAHALPPRDGGCAPARAAPPERRRTARNPCDRQAVRSTGFRVDPKTSTGSAVVVGARSHGTCTSMRSACCRMRRSGAYQPSAGDAGDGAAAAGQVNTPCSWTAGPFAASRAATTAANASPSARTRPAVGSRLRATGSASTTPDPGGGRPSGGLALAGATATPTPPSQVVPGAGRPCAAAKTSAAREEEPRNERDGKAFRSLKHGRQRRDDHGLAHTEAGGVTRTKRPTFIASGTPARQSARVSPSGAPAATARIQTLSP